MYFNDQLLATEATTLPFSGGKDRRERKPLYGTSR